MRSIVRSKVLNNESDESIYNYFRERYGDYIIMKPPFKNSTLFLWIAPFIFLSIGFVLILPVTRKIILKVISNKFKKGTETKKNYIDGEFEEVDDDNDRKL